MKDSFLSHENAALLNKNVVLRYIKEHGVVSRTDIWYAMNISRASVTQVIRQLQEEGFLTEVGKLRTGAGRAQNQLRLDPAARTMFIFDWNARKLCLTDLYGAILAETALDFPAKCMPSAFADVVLGGVEALRAQANVDPDRLLGIGFTMPGLIDPRSRMVLFSTELGWRDVDIGYLFADAFGDRVFLERTGNMIALGEYEFGAGRGCQHVLLVLLENEGIGASTVVRGDCQHGSSCMYGELGHIKLNSGILCSCGQRGCLEAVVRDRLQRNGGVMDDEIIEAVSLGISAAVNISDPGVVLLSGRLTRAMNGEQRGRLVSAIGSKVTNERSRALKILFTGNEENMGIRGMSAYIFSRQYPV